MRSTYLIMAGLVPGLLLGWLLAPKAPQADHRGTIDPPRQKPLSADARTDDSPGPAITKRLRRDREKTILLTERNAGELTPEDRKRLDDMEQREEVRRGWKVDAYVLSLGERLGLGADQVETLRTLYDRELQIREGTLRGEESDFEERLQALLTDAQKEPYQAVRAEERENKIELAAYGEMQTLQSAIPLLSAELKDEAYQVLAEFARRDIENPPADPDPRSLQQRRLDRIDALSSILAPEQLKAYEAQQSRITIPMSGGLGGMTIRVEAAE